MKLIAAILVLLAVVAGVMGPQTFFVVDETELAVLTRFGEPRSSISNPGLYVKAPFIERVTYFDKRILVFDAPPDSLLTEDKRRLVIDVYARGRITDPLLFRETAISEAQAASRAIDIIASELRREIGLDTQIDVIKETREPIMLRVRDAVAPKLAEFGIEIIDVRIKRADFPETVAESVYARMEAERKRIADRERAEGAERDAEVRANVDRQTAIIRAEAERDANIIRGEGEAEAVRIFAESLGQDPEFYAFQRSLEAYKMFLTENSTTVVLPADSALFQFLQAPTGVNGLTPPTTSASAAPAPQPAQGLAGMTPLIIDAAAPASLPAQGLAAMASGFLADKLGVPAADLTLVSAQRTEWPDASLGCPQPNAAYAQAITPGYTLTFNHKGAAYDVHSNQDATRLTSCD